jgi:hypothetical protein
MDIATTDRPLPPPAVSILSESGRELEVLIEREFGCLTVSCSLYFDEHYTQVECLDEDLSEAEQEAILAAWRGEAD